MSEQVTVGQAFQQGMREEMARDETIFDRWRSFFGGQRFYRFADPLIGHAGAARLFMNCRDRTLRRCES